MKILLISDTHGRDENLNRVLERETCYEYMIHCGDVEGRGDYIRNKTPGPCCIVAGNCDYGRELPPLVAFDLEGHRILVTHGHRQGVSLGRDGLLRAARQNRADIVCFGHIHRPVFEKTDGIWLCNPGSLTYPRQEGHAPSYMLLEVTPESVTGTICYV